MGVDTSHSYGWTSISYPRTKSLVGTFELGLSSNLEDNVLVLSSLVNVPHGLCSFLRSDWGQSVSRPT